MPKDPKKNVDRYKIEGGHLNEYEFQKNQEQTATKKKATKSAKGAAKKSASRKASKK